MPDIIIDHERSAAICQSGSNPVCQVVLTDGTQYISRGKNGEHVNIMFNRKRTDQNRGFRVELYDALGNKTTHETQTGSPVVVPVPTVNSISTYFYKIYYPWDPAGITVLPLDPVIIIEPKNNFYSIQTATAFAIGVAVAVLAYFMFLR